MTVKDLSAYTPEQREAVLHFVNFAADRLHRAGWRERIESGLEALTQAAERVWPRVLAGETVELGVADLRGSFEGQDDSEALEFVACAGYILLNGQDGPRATSRFMRNTIDTLVNRTKGPQ
jgi:hypothetical protein